MDQDIIDTAPEELQLLLQLLLSNKPLTELNETEAHYLSSPNTLIASISIGLTMPEDFMEMLGETFLQYFEYMARELRILIRNTKDAQLKQMPNALLTSMTTQFEETGEQYNAEIVYSLIKILKSEQFPVDQTLIHKISDSKWQHAPQTEHAFTPEEIARELREGVAEIGITSGYEFCEMFADELAIYPAEGIAALLDYFKSYNWFIDAMLLLSMHPQTSLAEAAASVLNTVPAKKWKSLTNKNYVSLIQRFGIESIKPHIRAWHSASMKHSKHIPAYEVLSCTASIPDTSLSMGISMRIRDKQTGIIYYSHLLYRNGYGMVDADIRYDIDEEEYEDMLASINQETPLTLVNPLFLSKFLPFALHQQQFSDEKISLDTIEVLSKLPTAWLEIQPFDLAVVANICKTDINNTGQIDQERAASAELFDTPTLEKWLVLDEGNLNISADELRAKYYNNNLGYIQSLAILGLMAHFELGSDPLLFPASRYVFCAKALSEEKALSEQDHSPFPLFDELAHHSVTVLEYQANGDEELADLFSGNAPSAPEVEDPKGYVLKIELDHSRPKIWRRFTVSSATDMETLHHLIQMIMGWGNEHLYMFDTSIGRIDCDEMDMQIGKETLLAWNVPLASVFTKPGQSMEYIYDFGDSWEHTITLEKINKTDCLKTVVTAGKGACPPEDCGGISSYQDLLRIMKHAQKNGIDKLDEEEQEQLEWYDLGEDFDAGYFDKKEVNLLIQ